MRKVSRAFTFDVFAFGAGVEGDPLVAAIWLQDCEVSSGSSAGAFFWNLLDGTRQHADTHACTQVMARLLFSAGCVCILASTSAVQAELGKLRRSVCIICSHSHLVSLYDTHSATLCARGRRPASVSMRTPPVSWLAQERCRHGWGS